MLSQLPIRVLVVDDDPACAALVRKHLSDAGYDVLTAGDGVEAMRVLLAEGPAIVIADWIMPGMDGIELCRAIRAHEGILFAYVIIVTAQEPSEERIVEALEAGADDYLSKPIRARQLIARIRAGHRIAELNKALQRRAQEVHCVNAEMELTHARLREANEKLELAVRTDVLTGLLNRREAMVKLSESWSACDRSGGSIACIQIDIDHFKDFNDTHGHATGDAVLRETARVLARSTRKNETVFRMGGEEFLVVCPGATASEAAVAAERLRKAVEAMAVTFENKQLSVTVSLGVSERLPGMKSFEAMLQAADDALYEAKRGGRNRVCVSAAGRSSSAFRSGSSADSIAGRNERGIAGRNDETGTAPISVENEDADRARALRRIVEFAVEVSDHRRMSDVLNPLVSALRDVVDCLRVAVLLPDAEGSALRVSVSSGFPEPRPEGFTASLEKHAAGRVYSSGQPLMIESEAQLALRRNDPVVARLGMAPCAFVAMPADERTVGVLLLAGRVDGRPFTPLRLECVELIASIGAAAIARRIRESAGEDARDAIVIALARLAEHRDPDIGRHLERVSRFSVRLALELRSLPQYAKVITDQFLYNLERAVPLHDIGKVAVPESVLRKPTGLTAGEASIMHRHCEIGARAIRSIDRHGGELGFLIMAEQIALCHHEYFDGSGYPRGLAGGNIPLAARIMTLADVYDAITTRRVYQEAMPHEQAVTIIRSSSGLKFDPDVVDAFMRCESDFARLAAEWRDHFDADASRCETERENDSVHATAR